MGKEQPDMAALRANPVVRLPAALILLIGSLVRDESERQATFTEGLRYLDEGRVQGDALTRDIFGLTLKVLKEEGAQALFDGASSPSLETLQAVLEQANEHLRDAVTQNAIGKADAQAYLDWVGGLGERVATRVPGHGRELAETMVAGLREAVADL